MRSYEEKTTLPRHTNWNTTQHGLKTKRKYFIPDIQIGTLPAKMQNHQQIHHPQKENPRR